MKRGGFKRRQPAIRNDDSDSDRVEEFKEEDCDSDFEGQLDEQRKLKKQRREAMQQREAKRIIPKGYLPSSQKKMLACIYCKFVINREKWVKLDQCPNCPQSAGIHDTTENFSNLIGSVLPKVSWVA